VAAFFLKYFRQFFIKPLSDHHEHLDCNIISIVDESSRKFLRTDGSQNNKRVEVARIFSAIFLHRYFPCHFILAASSSNFLLQYVSQTQENEEQNYKQPLYAMCHCVYRIIIPEHEPFFDPLRNALRSFQCNDDTVKIS
jgi:hypothetical protein